MKTQFISRIVQWAGIGLAIVLLGLFIGLGEDTGTELLMYGMYVFGAIMVAGMVANMVMSFQNKDWGLIRVIIAIVASLVLYFLFYFIAGGEGDEAIAEGCCITIYVLTVLAIIAVIGCATGVIYKLGNKN